MKIPVKMAIISHLSDAQELLHTAMETISVSRGVANIKSVMTLPKGRFEDVNKQINFAKLLMLTYPDLSVQVENSELDAHWREMLEIIETKKSMKMLDDKNVGKNENNL